MMPARARACTTRVALAGGYAGVRKKRNGRLLDGRTWDEMPALACA